MALRRDSADDTAIPAVVVGTVSWAVALTVVTFTQGVRLPTDGVWWWGVCAIGTLSGVLGLVFLTWRRRRLMRVGDELPQ